MEQNPFLDQNSDLTAVETAALTYEAPATPVDDENTLVFYGDRNEGQTIPFTQDA